MIHEHEERLVLSLDFGEFPSRIDPDMLRRELDDHVTTALALFLERYGDILGVPEEKIGDFVDEEAGSASFNAVLVCVFNLALYTSR